jgi:hypothetical protein
MTHPQCSLRDAKRALRLFRSEYVSRDTQRRNAVAWLIAVRQLGDRWLLASPDRRPT